MAKKKGTKSTAPKRVVRKKPPTPTSPAKATARSRLAKAPPLARQYRKNFLTQVIARVDFGAKIPISAKGPPNAIIRSLKKQFPIPEPKTITARTITITDKGSQEIRHDEHQWFYHSKRRDKLIQITDNSMYVEYKKYRSFAQLKTDFLAIVSTLFDAFDNLQVKRLGLRYIDRIELDEPKPTDWSKYFHQHLLAIFGLSDNPKTISRAFHVLELNYDDYSLRFQYGMPNPDYPGPIRKKIFTLDYDAYCTLLLNREEIAHYLTTFHDKLKVAFEEVITDTLRKKMGVIDA